MLSQIRLSEKIRLIPIKRRILLLLLAGSRPSGVFENDDCGYPKHDRDKNELEQQEVPGTCVKWACLEKTDTNSGGFDVLS